MFHQKKFGFVLSFQISFCVLWRRISGTNEEYLFVVIIEELSRRSFKDIWIHSDRLFVYFETRILYAYKSIYPTNHYAPIHR